MSRRFDFNIYLSGIEQLQGESLTDKFLKIKICAEVKALLK